MSDDKNQNSSPSPPLPLAGEGWGEGSGISLVQLALLQRRLRSAQEVQVSQALDALRQPQDGTPGLPPEHQWDGTRLRFRHPDGTWGAWVDLKPHLPELKDGEPGPPPEHQVSGHRLRFQQPNGRWGAWIDLRPKVAVYGGGSSWLPDTLPDADESLPEQFVVKQNGAWVRATLAQMQGWLGGGSAAVTSPVTVNGEPLTVGGQLVTVTL